MIQTIDPVAGLSKCLRSLRNKWIYSLGSFVLLTILLGTVAHLSGISAFISAALLVAGFVFSVGCLLWQVRGVQYLGKAGVVANYWYWLMLAGLFFVFPGIMAETGLFLLFANRRLRRLRAGSRSVLVSREEYEKAKATVQAYISRNSGGT